MAERSLLVTQPPTLSAHPGSRKAACLSIHAHPGHLLPAKLGGAPITQAQARILAAGVLVSGLQLLPVIRTTSQLHRRGLLSHFPNHLFPEWRKRTSSPLGKLRVAVGLEVRLGKIGGNSLPLTKEV